MKDILCFSLGVESIEGTYLETRLDELMKVKELVKVYKPSGFG